MARSPIYQAAAGSLSSMQRIAIIAALILPLLIGGTWVGALSQPPTAEGNRLGTALDNKLAHARPELVVIGNSTANRNLAIGRLGGRLGLGALDAAMPGTMAPTWTVVLRDRILANGHRPRLVIIASTITNLLTLEPSSDRDYAHMVALAGGRDPLAGRVRDGLPLPDLRGRIRHRSSTLRSSLMDGLRDLVTGLLFASDGPILMRGNEVSTSAAAAVLGEGGQAASGLEGWLPVGGGPGGVDTAEVADRPEDSFVAEMVDLAKAHEIELVFVRLPAREREHLSSKRMVARTRAVAEYLNERQIVFIDLAETPVDRQHYTDKIHMTREGSTVVTKALLAHIRERGVLEDRPFVPAPMPREALHTERLGAPPTVPQPAPVKRGPCTWYLPLRDSPLSTAALLRFSVPVSPLIVLKDGVPLDAGTPDADCDNTYVHEPKRILVRVKDGSGLSLGLFEAPQTQHRIDSASWHAAVTPRFVGVEATWVYPGTTTVLKGGEEWAGKLSTSALAIDGGLQKATLTVDGVAVQLSEVGDVMRGEYSSEGVGYEVAWTSPADGPFLLIRDLRLDEAHVDPRYLLGSERTSSASVNLLHAAASYADPPPEIGQEPPTYGRRGASIPIDDPNWLSLDDTMEPDHSRACVPLGVVDSAGRWINGRARAESVTFRVPKKSEGLRAVWNPERRCTWWPVNPEQVGIGLTRPEKRGKSRRKGPGEAFIAELAEGRWLLPGDQLSLHVDDTSGLHAPAGRLRLRALRYLQPFPLQMTLHADDIPVASWTFAEPHSLLDLSLEVPAIPRDVPVKLELQTDGGFLHLTRLTLSE